MGNANIIVEYKCDGCTEIHEIKIECPKGFVDSLLLTILGELAIDGNSESPAIFKVEDGVKRDITSEAMFSVLFAAIEDIVSRNGEN